MSLAPAFAVVAAAASVAIATSVTLTERTNRPATWS
jgi:hypothetical protein